MEERRNGEGGKYEMCPLQFEFLCIYVSEIELSLSVTHMQINIKRSRYATWLTAGTAALCLCH